MKKQQVKKGALGLFVMPNTIEAVLARKENTSIQVVRRFVRMRGSQEEIKTVSQLAKSLPGLKTSEEADYSIQIGNGRSGSDLFIPSEFANLGAARPAAGAPAAGARLVPFTTQLREILAECVRLGYESPDLAFVIRPPDVSYTELVVPPSEKPARKEPAKESRTETRKEKAEPATPRKRLLELLAEKHPGGFDRERTAFLGMTPAAGEARYLAVIPEGTEPVTPTVSAAGTKERPVVARLVEAETSLYVELAGRIGLAERQNTALVRVGAEDTLILFFEGRTLRHFERLRSLTTFDLPETVCSRVTLQQDEHKIGAVHHVLVHSEAPAERLVESFKKFYPEAAVEPLYEVLLQTGIHVPHDADGALTPSALPALSAALRLLDDRGGETVNLLSRKVLNRQRRESLFGWHTIAMLVVLFLSTLFFTFRYLDQQAEIERMDREWKAHPVDLPVANSEALKARVDSLVAANVRYTHALQVLDSLLLGSDRWSRTLERSARATGQIGKIWFSNVKPQGAEMTIDGYALSRIQVAALARRLGGRIETLDFADVGKARVFPFTMTVPLRTEMPHVATYLQETALQERDPARDAEIVRRFAALEEAQAAAGGPGNAPAGTPLFTPAAGRTAPSKP